MTREDVRRWVEGYMAAWASDDSKDIEALFSEDATYLTGPWDEPWEGRETIVREWIDRGDSGTEWGFTWDVVALDGDFAVIRGETEYPDSGHHYRNIWFVRLAEDGRARAFTEWWVAKPKPKE